MFGCPAVVIGVALRSVERVDAGSLDRFAARCERVRCVASQVAFGWTSTIGNRTIQAGEGNTVLPGPGCIDRPANHQGFASLDALPDEREDVDLPGVVRANRRAAAGQQRERRADERVIEREDDSTGTGAGPKLGELGE